MTSHAVNEQEALARKSRSIEILNAQGIEYIDHLPVIETEDECVRRSREEVIQRAITLFVVAVRGENSDQDVVLDLIKTYEADGYFTPTEQDFIDEPEPQEADCMRYSWRYEAVNLLLWALGLIDVLGDPNEIADVPHLQRILSELGVLGLRKKTELRPQSEILDAADLIYRYHWAVRNSLLRGEGGPEGLDPGVVAERHHTLNWLTGFQSTPWDEIDTST